VAELTSRDRVRRILDRQPVDRVAAFEWFWPETQGHWARQGYVRPDEDLVSHFGFDLRECWCLNLMADPDAGDQIVEEDEQTKLVRNGNGALLRWWKNKSGTPEHVDFLVKDRAGWREHTRPRVTDESSYERRINFEVYRRHREKSLREGVFFCWTGVNVFEAIHPVCGHEHMLVGMALDSEWVADMCTVYSQMLIRLMEILFAKEGRPDGLWFCEDMGFKNKPFMSPRMYRDIIFPAHKRTFDFAHSLGLPVFVHSCGFVEPLVPGLIEAGMDCLQAMEVKAGMDLLHLKKTYGGRIALCGGMDIRTLETNDKSVVQAELDAKLPGAMAGGGYMLQTDHSVSSRVEYDTYRYFLDRGREMGTYR